MIERALRWLITAGALGVALWEGLVLFPALIAASGGGTPFDLRIWGYGPTEARAYLAQVTPEAMALWQGKVQIADTALPLLLVPVLIFALRGRGQLWFLPALAYGLADLGENIVVRRLLAEGITAPASEILMASTLTRVKFIGLAVATGLALWSLWQAWRLR
jgi:hypothetical protein